MNKGLVNKIYGDILLGRRINVKKEILVRMFDKHTVGEDLDLDNKVEHIKKYFNMEVH